MPSFGTGLEKPCRLRTEGGLNEHLGRHQTVTGPVAMLAAYFELEKLTVGKSVILESANDDAGFVDVWDNDAVLAYVPTDTMGFEEPSFGYTYRLKGHPFVEQPYWDNSKKSWVYGVTFDRLPLLTGVNAAFLFKSVV